MARLGREGGDCDWGLEGRRQRDCDARTKTIRPDGWVDVYARLALGAAFLSAVASRFGLWDRTLDLKHFAKFLEYTAQVNSFMPPATIPLLAWAATVAETSLGILLISGWWSRWVALASAVLLVMFGTAMAISFGLKSPMDYSVFSASAAAALLAQRAFTQHRQQSSPNRT
jgi:putative oxidoreductase